MAKFPVKKYAALEMNRARYLAQGNVVSQTPLAAEFTEENPCEMVCGFVPIRPMVKFAL